MADLDLDRLEELVPGLRALVARAAAIKELRARKGRRLGTANRERLVGVAAGVKELVVLLEELTAPQRAPEITSAVVRELERFTRMRDGSLE